MLIRVAVLPVVSSEEEDRLDSVCSAISDTAILTLKLLGRYEVIEDSGIAVFSEDKILPFANRENVDNVIFGTVQQGDDGSITIEMSVWDRQKKEIVLVVEEKAEMILDVFDASDRIVISLIEGFSGIKVGYGSIFLEPEGTEESYIIELNGIFAGMNRKEFRNVLIGTYDLTIRQNRPFGSHTLYAGSVDVNERETTTVKFPVSPVTREEQDYFNLLDRKVIKGWNDPDMKKELTDELNHVMENLSGFNGILAEQREKYKNWLQRIPFRRVAGYSTSTRTIGMQRAKEIASEVRSLVPNDFKIFSADSQIIQQPRVVGTYYSGSLPYFEAVNQNRIPLISRGDIRVDGRRSDWVLLPVMISDSREDSSIEGADIVSVKMARDNSKLYVLISMNGDKVYSANGAWFEVFFTTDYGNINLNCSNWSDTWHTRIGKFTRADWAYREMAGGTMKLGRGCIEASFPYAALVNLLGTEKHYLVRAQAGNSNRQVDMVNSSVDLKLEVPDSRR